MKPRCAWLAVAWLAMAGFIATASAATGSTTTFPVDDGTSQVQNSNVPMQWDEVVPRAGHPSTVSGELTVIARLNVSQWRGHQGRIYMRLPEQPSGPVTATWTTRGPLQAGVLRAGQRTLVYAGLIQTDMIEDTMRLAIQTDGRRLMRPEQLNFNFEIDLDSP